MSVGAPASSRLTGHRLTGHRLTGSGGVAFAAALLLIVGAGCTSPLSFNTPQDAGFPAADGQIAGVGGQVVTGIGGQVVTGIGGQVAGIGGQPGTGGATSPPDAGPPDLPVDNGQPEVAPPVDVRPDVTDVRETGVDANGPVVCTAAATECHAPTLALRCLIAGGQTTGSCVECIGDGDCMNSPNGRRCDTSNTGATAHRCVECMNATVATDCPSLSDEHESSCNTEHHCLQGCSDDSTAELTCTKAGFICQPSGGSEPDHQCADCLAQGDCVAPLRICNFFVCVQCTIPSDCATGLTCDNVTGRCVACRDSTDCRVPGLRLCNPATHTCVASN